MEPQLQSGLTQFQSLETRLQSGSTQFEILETQLHSGSTQLETVETRLQSGSTQFEKRETQLNSGSTQLGNLEPHLVGQDTGDEIRKQRNSDLIPTNSWGKSKSKLKRSEICYQKMEKLLYHWV
ncbi:hypothetical protein HanIR_Chr05g0211821 [Helianthus annuus]|nr:hypothetical protein HanIR_Chr05g0211821 [Helianthus annuus]